jgi:hypothetical protein
MAVWGTLVAAERTVRAGLDLVAAVAELGADAEEQDRPGSGVALWSRRDAHVVASVGRRSGPTALPPIMP